MHVSSYKIRPQTVISVLVDDRGVTPGEIDSRYGSVVYGESDSTFRRYSQDDIHQKTIEEPVTDNSHSVLGTAMSLHK